MRSYALVNKTTGLITSICSWSDDRDFPVDSPVDPSEEVITIKDSENSPVNHDCYKYDLVTKEFVEFTPEPIVSVPYVDPAILALQEQNAQMQKALNAMILGM